MRWPAAGLIGLAILAALGWFVSGDYQLGRRWFTGVRFDRSAQAARSVNALRDEGGGLRQHTHRRRQPTQQGLV